MWEIYSYGGGDFLRMVFTGIASLFGNSDYMMAMQSVAILGFIGWMFGIAMSGGKGFDIKHLIVIIMVLGIGIVPKKDIIITDRVVPANSAVVGNVPLGLALVASGFSKIGDFFARSFETVFSLPNQVSYTGNGLLFASHLVEESTRFEFTDPRMAANFTDFWKSCVYYDLLLNKYSWKALTESSDLVTFLKDNTSVTRSFTYEDAGGLKNIVVCKQGLENNLEPDLVNEINSATNIFGARLVDNEATRTAAVTKFSNSLSISYQYMTGMAMSNAQIIGQNMLANSMRRGLSNFASEADASAAAEDFAMAKAERERMVTFSVMGKLAKKMLPVMQHLFEAFIYAIFPIVMLLLMLPIAGKAAIGYVTALMWINMWAPLYAILHFAVMYYSQDAASAAVVQAGAGFPTGLSIMTNTGLGHVLNDWSAIAGYLSMSIPMIAWMVVSRSGAMMAGLAGKIMQGFESPVSKASDEAASGNINVGNTRYDTHQAFQENTAPSVMKGGMTMGDGAGNNTRIGAGGQVYSDVAASSAPIDITAGSSVASTARQSLSEASARSEQSSASLASSNAALRSEIDNVVSQTSKQTGTGETSRTGESVAYNQARQNTERVVDEWAARSGVSVSNAKAIAAEINAQASAGGSIGFAELKAGIAARAGVEEKVVSQDDFNKVRSFMGSEEYSSALRKEAMAAKELSSTVQINAQNSDMNSFQAAMNNQLQAMEQKMLSVQQTEQAQKAVEYASQVTAQLQSKGLDGFYSWMSNNKGVGITEASDLVRAANSGDVDAKQILSGYTNEYIKSELAAFSANQADAIALKTGNFASETNVFAGNDEAQRGIQNTDLSSQVSENNGAVQGRGMFNQAYVEGFNNAPSAREVAQDNAAQNANTTMRMENESALMKPVSGVERSDSFTGKTGVKSEVENEQKKTVIDRAESVAGDLMDKVKN
jgi:hypothetical protein